MRRTGPPRRCRRGLTLIELLVAICIVAILMAGLGSAVLIAGHAVDGGGGPAARFSDAAQAVHRITADLAYATSVPERTDRAVTFTLPDRNGDGADETIRYWWSGKPGDPLMCQYGGNAPVPVAENVHGLKLSYLLRTLPGEQPPAVPQESEELLLISHDDAPGGHMNDFDLTRRFQGAQYFKPTLPTNTLRWKITRLLVRLRRGARFGQVLLDVRTADADQKPTQTTLEGKSIASASLPNAYQWIEFGFDTLTELDPASGYCLVLRGNRLWVTGVAQWEQGGSPMTPNTHAMRSLDGGSSWTDPTDAADVRFFVYGTVTTLGEPQWP
jgi:prepilin-type N-terminal cleavage/methylation domain-containing protein